MVTLSGAFFLLRREYTDNGSKEGLYNSSNFYLVWYSCIQTNRNELHLTVLEDTIPIGVDKNVKDSPLVLYLELFGIRILKQVRKTLSLEYGPYSALGISYSIISF